MSDDVAAKKDEYVSDTLKHRVNNMLMLCEAFNEFDVNNQHKIIDRVVILLHDIKKICEE